MDLSLHWKTIIDTLKEGLVVVGPDGTIAAVNPAAELLTGYSADELIGQSGRMLDCTGCVIFGQGTGEKWCKLFQDGTVKAKKCLITSKDHHSVSILKNATVLRDADGRVIGAVETLTDISEIVRQQEEILALRKTLDLDDNYFGILGKSAPMQRLFEMIQSVSQSDTPVMINGQSGTGKEMVARAIHWASPRECPGRIIPFKKHRTSMRRVVLKYGIDVAMLVAFILCFVTGILKVPAMLHLIWGGARLSPLLTLTRVHDLSGVILGIMVFAHLVLNWNWLVAMSRRIEKGK